MQIIKVNTDLPMNKEAAYSVCRFLTTDSSPITAYGFLDINFAFECSFVEHEEGSFFFLVPQVTFSLSHVDNLWISFLQVQFVYLGEFQIFANHCSNSFFMH